MKLGTKLLLITFFLSVVPLVAVGSIAYVAVKKEAERRSEEAVTEHLQKYADQFYSLVKQAGRSMDLLARDAAVVSYLTVADPVEDAKAMPALLHNKLRMLQRVYPEYLEIRLIRPDNYVDFRANHNTIIEPVFWDETRSFGSGGGPWIRVQRNMQTEELALYLGRGLWGHGKNAKGGEKYLQAYLSLVVDLHRFIWPLQESPWDGGGFLLMNDKQLLFASAELGERFTEDVEIEVLQQENAHAGYHRIGAQNFFHSRMQLTPDLWIHALVPESVSLAGSRPVGSLILGALLLIMLIGGPALFFLLRSQLVGPVLNLRQAFARLQQDGAELVEVPVCRDDELGELTQAFNSMSYELHASSKKIRELAFHDSLTGLPNRYLFLRTLQRSMEWSVKQKQQLALLFIDLDNFKVINDTFGHPVGDRVLTEVATRIQDHIRGNDYLGRANEQLDSPELSRLGGDEFTLLITPVQSPYMVGMISQRLIQLISEPVCFDGHECYLGASIGIALYPGDGESPEDLVKNADLAMFQAKKQGKGHFEYFSEALGASIRERARLDIKLHKVVDQEGFELFFQPLMDCQQEKIVSFEALIRWRDPELGFISPDLFIPLAEESGLVIRIGDWVIREACRWVQSWRSQGFDQIKVAINVSGVQMSQPGIADIFQRSLQHYALPPEAIYIELTETSLIQGETQVLENMHKLRALGLKIALDDFGTGYSSLSYLRKMPIDILKIDKCFVDDLGESSDTVVLASIINMAHALNMRVVAEGVEDQAMYQFLKEEGVDLIQGYYLSKPRAAKDIPKMLALGGAGLLSTGHD